jgi:hypothetical protein
LQEEAWEPHWALTGWAGSNRNIPTVINKTNPAARKYKGSFFKRMTASSKKI